MFSTIFQKKKSLIRLNLINYSKLSCKLACKISLQCFFIPRYKKNGYSFIRSPISLNFEKLDSKWIWCNLYGHYNFKRGLLFLILWWFIFHMCLSFKAKIVENYSHHKMALRRETVMCTVTVLSLLVMRDIT